MIILIIIIVMMTVNPIQGCFSFTLVNFMGSSGHSLTQTGLEGLESRGCIVNCGKQLKRGHQNTSRDIYSSACLCDASKLVIMQLLLGLRVRIPTKISQCCLQGVVSPGTSLIFQYIVWPLTMSWIGCGTSLHKLLQRHKIHFLPGAAFNFQPDGDDERVGPLCRTSAA